MATRYFRYLESGNVDSSRESSPRVSVLNPDIPPEESLSYFRRSDFRESVMIAILAVAVTGLVFSLILHPGWFFVALIAGIVLAILGATGGKLSSAIITTKISRGNVSTAISDAYNLQMAGNLTDTEARNVSRILWGTLKSDRSLEGNKPVQRALESISSEAKARIEQREQEVVNEALRDSTVSPRPNVAPQTSQESNAWGSVPRTGPNDGSNL